MVSLFGVVSLIVFVLCCAGLVLHYHVMKRRARLDEALQRIEESREDEADVLTESGFEALNREYEAAYADYQTCISRFPGIIMAKILQLPS
jgi:hypothetical protein